MTSQRQSADYTQEAISFRQSGYALLPQFLSEAEVDVLSQVPEALVFCGLKQWDAGTASPPQCLLHRQCRWTAGVHGLVAVMH